MTLRSAIYLQGNKFKLIDTILPHLEEEGRDILVEPFFGSGTISLNCAHRELFSEYHGNDIADWLIALHGKLKDPLFLCDVASVNALYKDTKEEYLKLREDYNKDRTNYAMLFNLMLRGNNNMVRFSGQGDKRKHNMPYGERNRFDIDRMLQHHHLSKDFNLSTMSFTLFLNRVIKNLDLSRVVVYIDSPYSNTTATYNENGGWTSQEDEILLNKVLKLRELGAKVVISNVFHNRGKTNQWLIDWSEEHNDKFDVHYLDRDYSNSASFKSDKKTVEVLLVSK